MTCETDLDANAQSYYAAMVSCDVVDSLGNYVASGSGSDPFDVMGFAQTVISFPGIPGATYIAMGSHSAILILQDYFSDLELGPEQPASWIYYDAFNFGYYQGIPLQYPNSFEWFGPGPEQYRTSAVVLVGQTISKAIRYYTQGELTNLIVGAQQNLPSNCDAVFTNVMGSIYNNASFFASLFATTFIQYPPGSQISLTSVTASTAINQPGRPITLYPDFYPWGIVLPPNFQGAVLTHEQIHRFMGWTDTMVQTAFGLPATNYTENITDFLLRGCQ